MKTGSRLARSQRIGAKVSAVLRKRTEKAQEQFTQRVSEAVEAEGADFPARLAAAMDPMSCYRYTVDAVQRSILFWEAIWKRGNNYLEHVSSGLKPVLHFDYETVLDARTFERPVNYALLRIVPPEGVKVDVKRRPYLVIDPRAGHGPGIGGFKDDSQVGVALRAGHPVYFVMFFRDPEPGQTLMHVCEAEQRFVKKVRALHPDAAKPAIIGNCQGGWAAMMLAASDPEDTGPIVINGAPMSYWGGAWSEGEGDNPMRYSGGMLGGTWLASLTADLGNGKFDGAHLVQNFENLNPANSLWDKYYHLFDQADTEPPRFLEFERWWGGYYLMNKEEIEWITRNLFVGNKLWSGGVKNAEGVELDLRNIRSPIILFASMGDNITPPQQAFNWVADVYGSTEEIKARGQVIVGLMHQSIGHLGIFVSGKVAKKEHTQIVSVLKSIELLPPGLYGMEIIEQSPGEVEVEFHERRLEDVAGKLNRFHRIDEKPFEAVAAVSDFNQRAYELFAQPWVQAMSNETSAEMLRTLHPLRVQNWAISQMNPLLNWIEPAAQAVKANRQAVEPEHPLRRTEKLGAEILSASLDWYRAMRDAATEAGFFSVYANMFSLYQSQQDRAEEEAEAAEAARDPRELPQVRDALASIAEGGYVEALARVAVLLGRNGEPLPLSRLELRKDLFDTYAQDLPQLPAHRWRSIRGDQEIIVRYEPERALATLPMLLGEHGDRARLLSLMERVLADRRLLAVNPSPEQVEMLGRIRDELGVPKTPSRRQVAKQESEPEPDAVAAKKKSMPRRTGNTRAQAGRGSARRNA